MGMKRTRKSRDVNDSRWTDVVSRLGNNIEKFTAIERRFDEKNLIGCLKLGLMYTVHLRGSCL